MYETSIDLTRGSTKSVNKQANYKLQKDRTKRTEWYLNKSELLGKGSSNALPPFLN